MTPRKMIALLLAFVLGAGALVGGCSAQQGKPGARPSNDERPLKDENAHTLVV